MTHTQKQTDIEEDRIIDYSQNFRGTGHPRYEIIGTVGNLRSVFIGPEEFYQVLTQKVYKGLENGNQGGRFPIKIPKGEKGLVERLEVGDRFRAEVRRGKATSFQLL